MTELIFFLTFILLAIFAFRYSSSAIIIPTIWWEVCLFINVSVSDGRNKISEQTLLLIQFFLFFFLVGYALNKTKSAYVIHTNHALSEVITKKEFYVLLVISVSIGYTVLKYLENFHNGLYFLRSTLFTEDSPIYPNKYIRFYFDFFLYPLLLAIIIKGAARRVLYHNNTLFLISSSMYLIKSIVENARFPIYYVIVLALLSEDWAYRYATGLIKIRTKFLILLTLGLVAAYAVTYFRSGDDENALDILINNIYLYHAIPFNVLDYYLENSDQEFLYNTYGLSSWLSIFDPVIVVLHQIGFSIVPESGVVGAQINNYIEIGSYQDGEPLKVNAFSTLILPFYRDGGFVFVLLSGYLIGKLLAQTYRFGNPILISMASIFISFNLILGIFIPVFNSGLFMSCIFIIIIGKNNGEHLKFQLN